MGEIEQLAAAIREQAAGTQVITEPDTLRDYAIDGLLPRLVVIPSNVEQVAQVVALTNTYELALTARGGGAHLNLGGMAERIDVVIETNTLTHLLEHEAPDLTCHVEAGLTLAALQAQLAEKNQWLALDPPNAAQATIGGILATNASGPKRLRFGTARDLVIGLRTIQASGESARSGGRVVKNVAGYDLNKLYIGSLSTLAIIVEANFKLHPLPAAERTLLLTFSSVADTMQTVVAIQGSLLTPSALELIDPGAARDMNDLFQLNLPTNGYTLAVDFEGSISSIDRQVDETRLVGRKYGALIGDDLTGEPQDHFWNVVREHTQGLVTCKVAILVTHVASYIQTVERICRNHDLEAAIVGHVGNGILYLELRPGDAIARLSKAIAELRRAAQEARGSLVIERSPVELKRRISVWGEPGSDFPLMRRLKQQFDPKGIFVQGRFVGGL